MFSEDLVEVIWAAKLKDWFPWRLGRVNILFSLILLTYFIVYHIEPGFPRLKNSRSEIFYFLYSFLTLNVFLQFTNTLLPKARIPRSLLLMAIIGFFNLLFAYYIKVKTPVDFSVIADNIGEIFSIEPFMVVVTSFGVYPVVGAIFVLAAFVMLDLKFGISMKQAYTGKRWINILTSGAVYLAIVLVPVDTYDEMTYFLKTVREHYFSEHIFEIKVPENDFPYMNANSPIHEAKAFLSQPLPEAKPNVFIILVESYGEKVIHAKTEDGVEITPVFNRLASTGLYIRNFYGNSIQTAKGHFTIFNSLIPALRGKVYVNYEFLNLRSLPAILQENDYYTTFFQAHRDITYDNTGVFMKRNGWEDVQSIYPYLTESDKAEIWGWGPEDGVFYRRFFDYLDSHYRDVGDKRPILAGLATIANHMRFNEVPPEKRALYPKPENIYQNFANSIHISDSQLQDFLDELNKRDYLKNSIVIITGDHSFPLGDHGITHNEAGHFEESFRVPFVMIWDGVLKPRAIDDIAFSQMDVAPSLLDLLRIDTPNHFQGVSIFSSPVHQHPIYLVQPYSGKYLSVLNYPEKYTYYYRKHRSFLVDVVDDPEEEGNLWSGLDSEAQRNRLLTLKPFFLNQRLIELNQVWRP